MSKSTDSRELSFSKRLAFASADIFGGGSFNIINFLYPGFLALTVGLSPFWISAIMLVARVWDAVSDPIMGQISDRTKSRMGKRRIWLVIAAPLIVLSLFLTFYPYSFSSQFARAVAVLFSYVLFCTVQTMVMIPYQSMASEISSSYAGRAKANSVRLGFSIFSSILCVALPGIIVDQFEGGTGYIVMGLSFGVFFGLAVAVTGFFAREEIITPPSHEPFRPAVFLRPLKLRPFREYLGMQMCLSMTMAIMSGLFFFYIDFYICRDATARGESGIMGMLAAALMFGMQIVALPFYMKLIDKFGKIPAYVGGALLWIVSALCLFFIRPETPHFILYLLAAAMGFGISGPGLVPHTLFGDVMDASEVCFKERSEGAFSGLTNFINKTVQAVGLAGVMAILGLAGFTEQQPGAAPVLAQPEAAQLALLVTMAVSPLVIMTVGILIARRYRISREKQKALSEFLQTQGEMSESGREEARVRLTKGML